MSRRLPLLALAVGVLLLAGPANLGAPPVRATPDRVSALGGSWFALGYNYPWRNYNYDFGDDYTENIHGQFGLVDSQFAELQANGTHVTRWYVFNDGARYPTFGPNGQVTGLPASFYQNFDDMLTLASAHNIYLIPVLWDSLVAQRGSNRAAVITDAGVRQSYLDNVLRPLLQRYGRHPNILAWSVMNEPDWPAGFTNDGNFQRIPLDQLRDFIRAHVQSVHTYTSQAVTLDGGGLPWLDRWTDLGLDLYLVHWYPWIDRSYGAQYSPYRRTADSFNVDKPIVLAEFPLKGTPHSVQQSLDTFYANGYAGALAWCYPNNVDEFCDQASYNRSRDVFRAWAQRHEAEVNIRPLHGGPPAPRDNGS
ncbi:MAG TPA: glycoside hydrolase family 2 TIM barrel-domain containing protein [Chloroflexota bacterium]|nr:glycoside hydrolase family 2 TIM barrel-domain containing protein [Chloroflexota bacterium]